eukprot:TRINITY_DN20415_c0_g1_i1.p1 TRINITY_DN20415_c0_g1~~TRINITY_DN20415_c0_g1_i1.p1  ORF type:complete len:524 (-),score=43.66 TRINITY_DN20415_c0_g1_i1:216-1787(-)
MARVAHFVHFVFIFVACLLLVANLSFFFQLSTPQESQPPFPAPDPAGKLHPGFELTQANKETTITQEQKAVISGNAIESTDITSENQTPLQVVAAWRNAKLDWHDLISVSPTADLKILVPAEVTLTAFLSHDTHGEVWGRDYGPLMHYHACRVVSDRCAIHNESMCMLDSFCGWCSEKGLCVDYQNPILPYSGKPACSGVLLRRDSTECATRRVFRVHSPGKYREESGLQGCKHIIKERVFFTSPQHIHGAMYYHWHKEYLRPFWQTVKERGGLGDLLNHIILQRDDAEDQFFDFYGVLSHFCYRRLSQIPVGVCFCADVAPTADVHPQEASYRDFIVHRLGLQGIVPAGPRIGIVSRRTKRFLLNEQELVQETHRLGYKAILLPLEHMTVFEQIRELRRSSVLIGIHGSALTNAQFMHNGSALVQLMPYKVKGGAGFFKEWADEAGVVYLEWTNGNRDNTVMHMHFVSQAEQKDFDRILARGGDSAANPTLFYTFWINQDTRVPLEEFIPLLTDAIQQTRFA